MIMTKIRTATVYRSSFATLDVVKDYLPSNYTAREQGGEIGIEGYDRDGWTLDAYIIPRLASALIVAKEIL